MAGNTFNKTKKNNIDQDISFLATIIQIQARLTSAEFNLNGFMQLIAEEMHVVTPATGAVVELVEGEEMIYRAATGTVASHLGLRLPIQGSISGLCVKTNSILSSDDTELDSRVNIEACRKVKARSLVVAPLIYQGNPVGVLKILSTHPQAFAKQHVATLQLMAGFIASGLAHQIAFETNEKLLKERTQMLTELQDTQNHLYHLAHYDYLTDLANRRTFYENLCKVLEESKNIDKLIGVMYLDIDHFKKINDNLGHDKGDALLCSFSDCIKHCIGHNDLAARMGGDEFVILLKEIASKNEAISIAKNIIDTFSKEFNLNDQSIFITTSIGLAFCKDENISADELIKQADVALNYAKKSGKNTYAVFAEY